MVDEEHLNDVEAFVPNSVAMGGSGEGSLKGRTFVAKDLFSLQGHRSSFGHERWRSTGAAATVTSPILTHMLDAGADLVGLTKLDQLAYSLIGNVGEGAPPRNVLDDRLFCGGSSSGSAAAVAAGLADIGLGTDTAGSIRVPAAACGLHSIRPSHGLIEPDGVIPLAHSFDVVGVFGLQASIIADVLKVLAPGADKITEPPKVKFAADVFDEADAQTARIGRAAASAAADVMGGPFEETEFGEFTSTDVGDLFARLQGREIWSNHGPWVAEHGSSLAEDVRMRLERCERFSQDPDRAQQNDRAERLAYTRSLRVAVEPGTVVVLPVMLRHGPMRDWDDRQLAQFRSECFRLAAPSSLTGAPQAVFSVHRDGDPRSVGVGLLAAPGGEFRLLEVMAMLGDDARATGMGFG
ncbi:amidase family protein [Candidatus Poriferisocius sp.]|uniref:amidase family protein n=1 Tax=Candidatus Poriferisocius sp. TaxID=3101276 RepID=UPI003B020CC0